MRKYSRLTRTIPGVTPPSVFLLDKADENAVEKATHQPEGLRMECVRTSKRVVWTFCGASSGALNLSYETPATLIFPISVFFTFVKGRRAKAAAVILLIGTTQSPSISICAAEEARACQNRDFWVSTGPRGRLTDQLLGFSFAMMCYIPKRSKAMPTAHPSHTQRAHHRSQPGPERSLPLKMILCLRKRANYFIICPAGCFFSYIFEVGCRR